MARHRLDKVGSSARGTMYGCRTCDYTVLATNSATVVVLDRGEAGAEHPKVNPIMRTRARGVIQPFNLGP